MDSVDGRAHSCPGSDPEQQGSLPIFRKFKLNPGVESGNVDADHFGGPSLSADRESPLIEDAEPRVGSADTVVSDERPRQSGRVARYDQTPVVKNRSTHRSSASWQNDPRRIRVPQS